MGVRRYPGDLYRGRAWIESRAWPRPEDPFPDLGSATQRNRFNRRLNERAADYIADRFRPRLAETFAVCPEVGAVVDPDDPHTLHVSYPAAFSEEYLRPEVRLEIGPLASWIPSGRHSIRPYAAEAFPQVFEDADCPVIAISAERTFWEKATILHQQAHRTSVMPPRYSRHYYEMCMLAGSQVKDSALADLRLLGDVVAFKQRFYPSRWARYDDARPGTFKLVPPAARLDELRRDYRGMEVMVFGQAPAFDFIIETLLRLEEEINSVPSP